MTKSKHCIRRFSVEEDRVITNKRLEGFSVYAIARLLARSRSSVQSRLRTLAEREERALAAAE